MSVLGPVDPAVLIVAAILIGALYTLRVDRRRYRQLLGSLGEGLCILDRKGHVTLWNDALVQLTGCPADQACGRRPEAALAALRDTGVPRAVAEALQQRSVQVVDQLRLPSAEGWRVLSVRIAPAGRGLAMFWRDLTEQRLADGAVKRAEERLALAADGAGDGLWEWDLRTGEFYRSARWRELAGMADAPEIGRSDEWFDRVHPKDVALLKQAVDDHLAGRVSRVEHEHRLLQADGTYGRCLCRGVAVRDGGLAIRIGGSLHDAGDRAQALDHQRSGSVEPLTGLCNRAVFVQGLGRRLDDYQRKRDGRRFAVLYLDLDRFKIVNDSLGHLVGDELLIGVSRRLEKCLREGDALARLGGDEFAILLDGLNDDQQANVIAFRIQDALVAPFAIGGREVFTSASIGIACGNAQYSNPEEMMRDADTAMYHAKAGGKARHEMFDADMHASARDRLELENDLRRAVAARDFDLHYQPIVLLASRRCVGFESLLRWSRDGKSISPSTFIPIAEELGLVDALGTWVLGEACRTFAGWRQRYPDHDLDCITVNVSSRQLAQPHFRWAVEEAVKGAGLDPSCLRLEITETALMDSTARAAKVLQELRDFGVKIYLDDFGTGFSSLSHLHRLPVDALKIDSSFVNSLLASDRPAIVESILALARTLNTSVIAEGIQNEAEASELERLGCTHAQGYLFSKPLSPSDAEAMIAADAPLGVEPLAVRRFALGA